MASRCSDLENGGTPLEHLADNHVVYRRGNTRVHVQTYDAEQARDIIKAKSNVFLKNGASSFFSGILAMIIVVVTLVIKLSEAITTRITGNDVDIYMIILYGICIIWTLYYNLVSSLCQSNFSRMAKTNQSTNRWLKGVIIIFGTAIVLKDSMEFLSHTIDDNEECSAHYLSAVISALHLFFVMNQSVFIFRYTKLFLPDASVLPRTGLMLLIATNLSTWIESVVSETVVALNPNANSHSGSSSSKPHEATPLILHHSNISEELGSGITGYTTTAMIGVETADSCACHSYLCKIVHVAEKFMFPFLIEFSLVASCMLYVTWRNVGKLPPPYEKVVKPSYQLFGSYIGISLGMLTAFATIIVMIILATRNSGVDHIDKTYLTEIFSLIINNSFLISLQICMIVACLVGFYVFYKNERPVVLESTVLLDEVLLLICMLGPLVSNSFSLLAIIAGEENKTDKTWVVSMIFRLCDTFQCLLQVVLVLFGLQREPETTEYAKDTVDQIKKSFQAIQATDEDDHLGSRNEIENIAQSYLRSRHNSINSVISALFSNPGHQTFQDEPEENTQNLATITQTIDRGDNVSICLSIREQTVQHIDPTSPKIEINGIALEASDSLEIETSCCENPERETNNKKSIIKVVSQSKVSQPRGGRLVLREVSMFLLIANACLWMYMSLDGTAFSLYLYQSQFFGASVWTTILMICRPLSIFFRMHSAGCLFEIWSFA